MRVRVIIGILEIIAAALFLKYTLADIYQMEDQREQEELSETVEALPIAGITLYINESVQEAYMEPDVIQTSQMATPLIVETIQKEPVSISEADAEILERLAMAEAGNQGVEGKALVMLVVLNRVSSTSFPNTIKDVVFQSGQFSTVGADGR